MLPPLIYPNLQLESQFKHWSNSHTFSKRYPLTYHYGAISSLRDTKLFEIEKENAVWVTTPDFRYFLLLLVICVRAYSQFWVLTENKLSEKALWQRNSNNLNIYMILSLIQQNGYYCIYKLEKKLHASKMIIKKKYIMKSFVC